MPATQNQESALTPRTVKIRKLLRNGYSSHDIADKLAKGDPKKYRSIRSQCYRIIAQDPEYQAYQALAGAGVLHEAAVPIVEAVVKRAQRGRIDAAKLALEMVGYHTPNSKVNHEHSGEVKITLTTVPRPPRQEEEVVDAEVVDDG